MSVMVVPERQERQEPARLRGHAQVAPETPRRWYFFACKTTAPRTNTQSKIIGILWMVPIYAIDSFVSLRFKNAALYVDMLRDCYEGYALYLFLALMVGYLGDGDEYKVCWTGGVGAVGLVYGGLKLVKNTTLHTRGFVARNRLRRPPFPVRRLTCVVCGKHAAVSAPSSKRARKRMNPAAPGELGYE